LFCGQVFIGVEEMAVLQSTQLIFASVMNNSNKFYRLELHCNGDVVVNWGRVGANAQTQTHSGAGVRKYDALLSQKLAKGYERAQVATGTQQVLTNVIAPSSLKAIATEQIAADDLQLRDLVSYLSDCNIHSILSQTTLIQTETGFSTPLGPLTASAITEARQLLGYLSNLSDGNRIDYLNRYLRLVPQKINALNTTMFSTPHEWKVQSDLLDSLESVSVGGCTPGSDEKIFDCKLSLVPHTTDEGKAIFRSIKKQFESTRNASHVSSKYTLKRVWDLRINPMADAFEQSLGNIKMLWHGTKAANLLSILKCGLMVPPATANHCTGRMFGDGIYFSEQSTKSLNYATDFWNKTGGPQQRIFMLLVDVALGKEMRPKTQVKAPARGFDSVWIEPGTCGVMNQETIVYRASQVNPRYLCEFA
jgi:poly [ADP-ribose] polymerase 2/3/4